MTGGLAIRPIERLLISVDVSYYNWSSFNIPSWRGPIKEWNDTVVPRGGVQVRVWDTLVARCGYYFDPTPVPDQSDVESNYLDTDKHVFSLGLGYAITKLPWIGDLPLFYPVEIDGYFQFQHMPRRYQAKDTALTGQPGWYIDGSAYALGFGVSMGF
jgi:long-chain fatty acid transport protein